eukprot:g2570.t1
MSDTKYPKRTSLEGLVGEIFKLVSRGATPEQWAEWLRVPLEHAAADGNIDLFKALIGAGADGGAGWKGCEGRTLFDAAARGGNAEVVSALVAAGAQPDVNVVSAASGRSALFVAASLGHEDAARRLVLAGADVNFRDPGDGCDVLVKAAEHGCGELVNDLLIGGVDPNASRYRHLPENTALHIAAKSGFEGIVSSLLTRGVDKDVFNGCGYSPLTTAAEAGKLAVVNTLLAAGADIGRRDGAPLRSAAGGGHVEVMKAILGHGADVNAADEDNGGTALHAAAGNNEARAIEVLVEAGADIERESDGETPLCISVQAYNGSQATRALLRHGANYETRDLDGNTPLHLACFCQRPGLDEKVDLLLRSGADEAAVNNDEETPARMLESRDFATHCSSEELERAQLLLARAPNDRAWRRRSWLVMLGSRAFRAKAAGSDNGGFHGHRGDGGLSKMPRSENDGGGGDDMVVKVDNGHVIGFGGQDGGFGAVVVSLVGLELEGVFRKVVGFL